MKINKERDIGYIFKGGNAIPIKPMSVDCSLIRDHRYKEKEGTKLYIHDEIIKYYLATNVIKVNDDLYQYYQTYLYEALNNRGFTIVIRANHQLVIFLANRISREDYYSIRKTITELNEPVQGIGYLSIVNDNINCEQFTDLESGIKTVNKRYKNERENKRR